MPVLGAMQPAAELKEFSPKGDLLAVCSPDGRLSIWAQQEGGPARLEQQLVPSQHLAASPVCLAWCPPTVATPGKKRKKGGSKEKGDLLALATSQGAVLLYSVSQGQLLATLGDEGGTGSHCLAWSNSGTSIYTGGEEGRLSVFSATKQALITSWKAGTDPIHRVAVSLDDSLLVAGGRQIKVWDIATRTLVKSLTGHSSPVSSLAVNGGYIFSCGREDTTVCVWHLDKEEPTNIQLTLGVNSEVESLQPALGEEGQVTVSVVTSVGSLQVFSTSLQKRHKKPVKPSRSLTIATDRTGQDKAGRVEQIHILAARLGTQGNITIGYGTGTRPRLEKLNIEEIEENHCLVRPPPQSVQKEDEEQFTKTVTPNTEGNVTFLAPGVTLPVGTGKLGKRKSETPGTGGREGEGASMEDRLALLATTQGTNTPPRTDTLAQLLSQGLHSNDSRILQSVLDRADPQLIDNTVARIPVEAVVPLVNTLMRFIKGRGKVDGSHAKWLRSVLATHTGFLVSVPECRELLSPVYALLEARTQHYSQVLQLRGKLELLTKQTEAAGQGQDAANLDQHKEALLVYQDDSSDELEDVMDDLLVPASDTDDDWEANDDADETMEASKLESDSDDCVVVNGSGKGEEDSDGSDSEMSCTDGD